MTFSSRDKVALLIAGSLGVAFWYLGRLSGYAGAFVIEFYAVAIIPLVVWRIADQRKFLVWQACVLSFVLTLVVADTLSGQLRGNPIEALEVACGFWIIGSLLSSPLPLFIYWQRVKGRKYNWLRFFLFGGMILALVSSRDPFLVFSIEFVWILVWSVKFTSDWRTASDQDVARRSALLALAALVLVTSVPVLAITFFKQRTFGSAMEHSHYSVARRLVAVGADVNGLDAFGETALADAAWNGDTNGVKVLISMGADVNLEQKSQFQGLWPSGTALAIAASAGRSEICRSLLSAGADVNKQNKHGMTPFLVALARGNIECASAMLDYGADVNPRDALGETPLMLLCQFDPNDPTVHHVLDQLLAKGADVIARDDKGHTAEDWALLYHRQEMAERLRKIRELEARE
jgi:hypothetical protein